MAKVQHTSDLLPDNKNANLGSEFGDAVLRKSIQKNGLARSIVVDRDGRIIAGNKTAEKCVELGLEEVIVVPTDGTKLVVVQRTDVSIDSKKGRELALADNRTSEANLTWDFNTVEALVDDFDVDSLFCPEPRTKKAKSMFIKVTISDEREMNEAADEIAALVSSKWMTAEVKVSK